MPDEQENCQFPLHAHALTVRTQAVYLRTSGMFVIHCVSHIVCCVVWKSPFLLARATTGPTQLSPFALLRSCQEFAVNMTWFFGHDRQFHVVSHLFGFGTGACTGVEAICSRFSVISSVRKEAHLCEEQRPYEMPRPTPVLSLNLNVWRSRLV
jgi:hypothetical protein